MLVQKTYRAMNLADDASLFRFETQRLRWEEYGVAVHLPPPMIPSEMEPTAVEVLQRELQDYRIDPDFFLCQAPRWGELWIELIPRREGGKIHVPPGDIWMLYPDDNVISAVREEVEAFDEAMQYTTGIILLRALGPDAEAPTKYVVAWNTQNGCYCHGFRMESPSSVLSGKI